jgi:hypothetical protein
LLIPQVWSIKRKYNFMFRKIIWILDLLILMGIFALSYQRNIEVKEYYIVSPLYVKIILILVAIFSIYISFKKPKGKTKSFHLDNSARSFKKQKGKDDINKPLLKYVADEYNNKKKDVNSWRIIVNSLSRFFKPTFIMIISFILVVMLVWMILIIFKN